jgi:hypothetical protein
VSAATIHLHWCWHRGPKMLRGLLKGFSLCGVKDVPIAQLTAFPADADCVECLTRRARVAGAL